MNAHKIEAAVFLAGFTAAIIILACAIVGTACFSACRPAADIASLVMGWTLIPFVAFAVGSCIAMGRIVTGKR